MRSPDRAPRDPSTASPIAEEARNANEAKANEGLRARSARLGRAATETRRRHPCARAASARRGTSGADVAAERGLRGSLPDLPEKTGEARNWRDERDERRNETPLASLAWRPKVLYRLALWSSVGMSRQRGRVW